MKNGIKQSVLTTKWECAIIALFAIILVSPALFQSQTVIGEGVDAYGTFWFYQWIADCILTGTDPSHSDLFFYPYGKDIFGHTGNNFVDALLAVPFIWMFGFPDYQPVFVAVLLLANGLSFNLLLREFTINSYARLTGSLMFVMSPFCLSELTQGRPTQAFMAFAVLSLCYFIRIHHEAKWRNAVLAGLFAALQGWTYWFGGFFLGFCLFWIFCVCFDRKKIVSYGVALFTCALLVAPAVVAMAEKRLSGEIPGMLNPKEEFWSIPALQGNHVLPTLAGYQITEPMGMPVFHLICWGVPVLLAIVWAPYKKIWIGLLVVGLLLASGPIFYFFESEFPLYHYIFLYRTVPLFSRLWFPYRAVGFAVIAAAMAIAFLLHRSHQQRPKITPYLGFVLILSAFVEQNQFHMAPLLTSKLQVPAVYHHIKVAKGAILELPIGYVRPSILWQTVHRQPTFGGMGENVDYLVPKEHKARLRHPLFRQLVKLILFPHKARQIKEKDLLILNQQGFRFITLDREIVLGELKKNNRIKDRRYHQALHVILKQLVDILGDPWAIDGALVIWNRGEVIPVPPELTPSKLKLYTKHWQGYPRSALELKLQKAGRLPSH